MMERNFLADSIIGYDAIWEFNYDAIRNLIIRKYLRTIERKFRYL